MARPVSDKPKAFKVLSDFLQSLKFEDLEEGFSTYEKISHQLGENDRYVLNVFFKLASLAINRGEVYFALRFENLVQTSRTIWDNSYAALKSEERKLIQNQIAQKKRALTAEQKRFIELFHDAIKVKKFTKKIEDFMWACQRTDIKYRSEHLKKCLFVYIEISQRYSANDKVSLEIFFAFSSIAIAVYYSFFAQEYYSLINSPRTVWASRYQALADHQKQRLGPEIEQKRKAVNVNLPPKAPDIPEGKKSPPNRKQQEFSKLFDRFMAKRNKEVTSEMNEFIEKLTPSQLRDCLSSYFERNPDTSEFSSYVFFSLLAWAISKGEPYFALKYEALIQTQGSIWSKHFTVLSENHQKPQVRERIKLKKKEARILDYLKLAYFQKHYKDIANLKELQAFGPKYDTQSREMLDRILSEAQLAYKLVYSSKSDRSSRITNLVKSFDDLANLFQAQKDDLLLLSMLKWCRESRSVSRLIRGEFYWYGVGILYLHAIRSSPEAYKKSGHTDYNRMGFNDEEKLFFFGGVATDEKVGYAIYRSDFEFRFRDMVYITRSPEDFTKYSKAHLELLAFADARNMSLAPMIEAELVRDLIKQQKGNVSTKRITVRSKLPINRGKLPFELLLGQSVGDYTIVWQDEKEDAIYLELNGLERILFIVDSDRLAEIYDDASFRGVLWERTRHLLPLIELFYKACSYLPDLLTGGFAGLVKAILIDVIVGKIAGDSVAAQIVLGAIAGKGIDMAEAGLRNVGRATTQVEKQLLHNTTDAIQVEQRNVSNAAKAVRKVEEAAESQASRGLSSAATGSLGRNSPLQPPPLDILAGGDDWRQLILPKGTKLYAVGPPGKTPIKWGAFKEEGLIEYIRGNQWDPKWGKIPDAQGKIKFVEYSIEITEPTSVWASEVSKQPALGMPSLGKYKGKEAQKIQYWRPDGLGKAKEERILALEVID